MEILSQIWAYIATNILTQPAYFIGLMVLIGYTLLKKTWYQTLSGFVKAVVGFMILTVGSGGLVSNFRPVLVGLKDRFQLNATVIDPYFGQNAVMDGLMPVFGRTFSSVMFLLFIAFIFNILLVKFKKYTKMRSIFTTGHVQMQQASTAFWIMLFCFPQFTDNTILLMMGLLLGLYWAVGTNLLVKPTQELTNGANFSIAHQQMFGVALTDYILTLQNAKTNRSESKDKKLEEIELPGWLSLFKENMVATALLMFVFFGSLLLILGQEYLIAQKFLKPGQSFLFYVLTTAFMFAVYLEILKLGVKLFVGELTKSFEGIQKTWLPGAVVGVDCAVSYGFDKSNGNAVTVGFLCGAIGQFIAIGVLIFFNSPTLIIAGFVPVFFDNATIGVYANAKGGARAAMIFPFLCGLCQVFGSAFVASFIGLAPYGGYLGMWDWAVLWSGFAVSMHYLSILGFILCCLFLIIIPQLQYRKNKDAYFLVAEDYETYKRFIGQSTESQPEVQQQDFTAVSTKPLKLLCCCGSGMGSSGMSAIKLNKVCLNNKLNVQSFNNCSVAEGKSSYAQYDILMTSKTFEKDFADLLDNGKCKIIFLENVLSEVEMTQKLKDNGFLA